MNWQVLATVSAPIVALFVGAALNRRLERRPKLVSFYSQASTVQVQPPEGAPINVRSHTVVVRNTGGAAANNVRLGHATLPPNYSVFPAVNYNVANPPGGGAEIVFPKLVPGEQVSVTYLYFAPIVYSQVNSYCKCDEGLARIVTMLLQQHTPAWQRVTTGVLAVVGAIAIVYLLLQGALQLWAIGVTP